MGESWVEASSKAGAFVEPEDHLLSGEKHNCGVCGGVCGCMGVCV